MSNWYTLINSQTNSILQQIKDHPFIVELMNGTLPKETFYFYIHQDALYLAEYKKVLAQVGVLCNNEKHTQFFLDAATGIIHVEDALHQHFLKDQAAVKELSPTCELYTSYLSKMANTRSLEEALAAVLPCFTIYKEVGDFILENQTNADNNPYQDWINTYGGEEFAHSVQQAIAITIHYAAAVPTEKIERMNHAFRRASQLEWMFWDSAYQHEKWKV